MKHLLLSTLLLSTLLLAAAPALAQSHQPIIQFTGLVVSGDSLLGVPAVWVGVPQTHRSTVTDPNGYFSFPVVAGDSVEVRAFHSTTHLRVPLDYPRTSYSLLVQLQAEARSASLQLLPAGFAQRFLALKLPPSLTVAPPPVSTKALRPPKYDRLGRKSN